MAPVQIVEEKPRDFTEVIENDDTKFQLFEILKNSLKKSRIKSQKKIRKNSQKKLTQMVSI